MQRLLWLTILLFDDILVLIKSFFTVKLTASENPKLCMKITNGSKYSHCIYIYIYYIFFIIYLLASFDIKNLS